MWMCLWFVGWMRIRLLMEKEEKERMMDWKHSLYVWTALVDLAFDNTTTNIDAQCVAHLARCHLAARPWVLDNLSDRLIFSWFMEDLEHSTV